MGVPIGGWLSQYQGFIRAPGAEWEPRELLRGYRLSAWQFDNLIADQQPLEPYPLMRWQDSCRLLTLRAVSMFTTRSSG